jgi:lysine 2,3-aminomutase
MPVARSALSSALPLDEKRRKLEEILLGHLARRGNGIDLDPSSVEWVLVRDATHVFLNLLLPRNESLAEFSLLEYLCVLFSADPDDSDLERFPKPETGFLLELTHLVRGITGTSRIYEHDAPAFANHEGRKAAQLRSASLSRMSRGALEKAESYTDGLQKDVIRRRSRNKSRILRHFDATDVEWNDWQWQVAHTIRDAETLGNLVQLSEDERAAIDLARQQGIPFGITPYYVSLMDARGASECDRAVRAQVIPSLHYVSTMERERQDNDGCLDFMLERDTSPIDGITRRYPMICILKPVLTCPQICVYCQRNWQLRDIGAADVAMPRAKLDAALEWIADTPEIREVLITGGDPFFLSDSRLRYILSRLAKMDHVIRIRIGTRTPVTLPMRVTDNLVRIINQFHVPGKREVLLVTHFEHPSEITPAAMEAVQKIRRYGLEVYNQLVYTFFNSRRFEACALRNALRLIGVTPYYTFNTKGKEETADFRVPIARLLQEQKEENRLFPGTVRTDEVVFNVPRLGKNYLRAGQHHDVIGLLPDGRRVYEFHPWEKKLALVDKYVYTDVSVHDYMQRLAKAGEKTSDYRTIWYYY